MARRPPAQEPPGPSLFETAAARAPGAMPLAERVRPRRIDEVVGQRELLGSESPLRRAILADRLPSMILWGPPGSGKTTLARVVADHTEAYFVPFSAVLGGVADVRRIVAEASERRRVGMGGTVLFVDEIHRFNKSQQDAFLPHVENGTVTLIGATTENPSFSLNAPLLSRCVVYRLEALDTADLVTLLERALGHPLGFDGRVETEAAALEALAEGAGGDARRALGLLEVAIEAASRQGDPRLTMAVVSELGAQRTLLYDRGEEHYNVASALIKSLRGSDPDAAVYWMMRMIEAGDDPMFVLRRLLIFASEDIGNADPRALSVAVAADQAFQRLGMPEGLYAIAQATLYLACAPKSNAATLAWHGAREAVREHGALPVPKKLRNAPTRLMREMGYGQGYRYAHDEEDGYARGETYLPEELVGTRFYEPTGRGLEERIGVWLRKLRGEGGV
jgi:putative ATPase